MAQNASSIKNKYPLPVYNYRVTILSFVPKTVADRLPDIIPDGAETVSFSEVSGLAMEYDPVVYKDGFSFMVGHTIIPGMVKDVSLTLKKGITRNGKFLYRWMHHAYRLPGRLLNKRDIFVDLCDENGNASVRWTVYGAMPVKLDAPSFSADSQDVAIESMELIAKRISLSFDLT